MLIAMLFVARRAGLGHGIERLIQATPTFRGLCSRERSEEHFGLSRFGLGGLEQSEEVLPAACCIGEAPGFAVVLAEYESLISRLEIGMSGGRGIPRDSDGL